MQAGLHPFCGMMNEGRRFGCVHTLLAEIIIRAPLTMVSHAREMFNFTSIADFASMY